MILRENNVHKNLLKARAKLNPRNVSNAGRKSEKRINRKYAGK